MIDTLFDSLSFHALLYGNFGSESEPMAGFFTYHLVVSCQIWNLYATYGYIMHRSRIGVWIKLTSNFIVLGEGESRNLSSRYFSSSSSWSMRNSISIHSSQCLFKNYTTVLIRLVWIDIWFYLHHLYSISSQCLFKNYTTVLIRHSFHYATPCTRHLVALGGLGKRVHLDVFTTSTSSSLPRKFWHLRLRNSQLGPRYHRNGRFPRFGTWDRVRRARYSRHLRPWRERHIRVRQMLKVLIPALQWGRQKL